MIEVDHLTKAYGPRVAVEDVSFTVAQGEILGFLGPNGAGKTTTMRMLAGYLPPTEGRASVAGFDVTRQSLAARTHIGYLPENVPLYPELTVERYLEFLATIRGVRREKRAQRIVHALEVTATGEVRHEIIGRLSKGYRQRVGLAQAILHDPEVMILDEPTVGLDPKQIIETRALIKRLGADHTIILSTHILPEVSMTCNRVIIINRGRLVASDTPDNLVRGLHRGQRIRLEVEGLDEAIRPVLSRVNGVAGIELLDGDERRLQYRIDVAGSREVRHELARAVVNGGWNLLEVRLETATLEDIFLQLTTTEETAPDGEVVDS